MAIIEGYGSIGGRGFADLWGDPMASLFRLLLVFSAFGRLLCRTVEFKDLAL